jgi:glycosyltransferase involved in cell wall biosynthesis
LNNINTNRTHIVAIAPYNIFPAKMGGQKGIACFYAAFSTCIDVTLVSVKSNAQPDNFSGAFMPVMSNAKSRYFNPFGIFAFLNIIRKQQATHLVLEHPYLGWMGFLLKKITGIALIIHSHNIESLRFKSTGKWWWKILWEYEKWTHRQADINFFISDEDQQFAIKHFKLNPSKCHTITYGFDFGKAPSAEEKSMAKSALQHKHNIPSTNKILLFNGTLDYAPNLNALKNILIDINPILLKATNFNYTIIICGKGLPADLQELKSFADKNIVYAGFVDDITVYFKGADIFINPVVEGGGIKTKLVEALGNNMSCISTIEGAIGVPEKITGGKLTIVSNTSWDDFSSAVIHCNSISEPIDEQFFNHFYWDNIAEKAASIINSGN